MPSPDAGLGGVAEQVGEPARRRVDVQRAVEHVRPLPEDRLGAVAVVGVDVDHRHPLVAGRAQRLGGDGGVVEVAGPAVPRRRHVVSRRPAQRVRRPLTRGDQVDGGQCAVDRGPRGLPGAGADQGHRVVAEPPGLGVQRCGRATAPCRRAGRRSGRSTAPPGPGRPARRTVPSPRRSSRPRGRPSSSSSWTASSTSSSCGVASCSGAPSRAARIASTRSATSVPGIGVPDPDLLLRARAAGCPGTRPPGSARAPRLQDAGCSGRMSACRARVTWESGSAPCRRDRPTRCSTWRAWGSGTPPCTATRRIRRPVAGSPAPA